MSNIQKTPERNGGNLDLKSLSRGVLEVLVKRLIEKRRVSPEVVKDELAGIREETGELAKAKIEDMSKKELSPEEVEVWFCEFKTRFDALPQLHKGVKFADVEKSLKADPESMRKLMALDEKGHAMNVFGKEKGEFIFASGWDNYEKVSEDHRNITFDPEGQKLAEKHGYKRNGNAVSIIAKIMGVSEKQAGNYLADPRIHEQLRKAIEVNGWAWLKTDVITREAGYVFVGYYNGVGRTGAVSLVDNGSFRAALRVKKV